jgi:hypothetical protein
MRWAMHLLAWLLFFIKNLMHFQPREVLKQKKKCKNYKSKNTKFMFLLLLLVMDSTTKSNITTKTNIHLKHTWNLLRPNQNSLKKPLVLSPYSEPGPWAYATHRTHISIRSWPAVQRGSCCFTSVYKSIDIKRTHIQNFGDSLFPSNFFYCIFSKSSPRQIHLSHFHLSLRRSQNPNFPEKIRKRE